MNEKLTALVEDDTWSIVPLSHDKHAISSH